MVERNIRMPKFALSGAGLPSGNALALLGLVALLLSAWFGVSALRQWQGARAEDGLAQQRDAIRQVAGGQVTRSRKALLDAIEQPGVRAALAAGEPVAAAQALSGALPNALRVELLPLELQPLYARLPAGGFAGLALAEEALGSAKPVVRVARVAGKHELGIAQALSNGQVALAAFSAQPLLAAVQQADAGRGYLALRQGTSTLVEQGDAGLAGLAESRAAQVAGSPLRVVAALPALPVGPFGLGMLACALLGGLLALAGLGLLFGPRLRRRNLAVEPEAPALTLDEVLALEATQAADDALAQEAQAEAASASASVAVDRGIFRAYDIRGVVGQTLSREVAEAIGRAIGSLMHEHGLQQIVVGRDGRLSGPELAAGLIEGLRSTGRDVVDIGLAPTPLVYFAAYQDGGAGCCVAVTGSHNPPDYNGFKIVVGGETLSGDAIADLHARLASGRLHRAETAGGLESRDLANDYVLRVASDIQIARPLKVVVDAGNGAAGQLGPAVLSAIGAEVVPLFCEIDGTFPNHHPDPSEPHNLEDLRRRVAEEGAHLGLAFDGDGDRLGVVTPAGANIYPDRLLMLFAADVLERQPGAVIVYDVKCSGALMPWILRHGGSPLMWKTGHSLIKAKMRETEAELAGEMSGHFFFKERWYGFDDGIYAAARLLEILAARDEDADAVFASIPEGTSTPELKIPMEDPHAFIERFVAEGDFEGARGTTIDGLRADWPDGWGLVRASNTTPILVLRFEAADATALARIQHAFGERLQRLAPGIALPF